MLIVGLLESEFNEAVKRAGIKGQTMDDILLEGRFIKIHWNRGTWYLENMKKSRQDMMNALNVTYEGIDKLK